MNCQEDQNWVVILSGFLSPRPSPWLSPPFCQQRLSKVFLSMVIRDRMIIIPWVIYCFDAQVLGGISQATRRNTTVGGWEPVFSESFLIHTRVIQTTDHTWTSWHCSPLVVYALATTLNSSHHFMSLPPELPFSFSVALRLLPCLKLHHPSTPFLLFIAFFLVSFNFAVCLTLPASLFFHQNHIYYSITKHAISSFLSICARKWTMVAGHMVLA